ncbi:MAG: HAMP domain-containing histidine kinase, partial [Anaerolineae bacterium]|nr:HAMP domain-containing histidine kinase [Anaerolineae bacterium]
QMTADIAHDLRTPLGVISGYLEALRDGTLSGTQERFDTLYTEAQLLQRLVDDLRTLSLADAGELSLGCETIHVSGFLQDIERFYASSAEAEGISLQTEIAPALPTMDADRARLGQILANLISNAIRHTPQGGSITLGAVQQGEQVRLFVRDTGEGIEQEKLAQIFDRFYRVDESRTHTQEDGQTGLGLAITKALVEAHGGSIQAQSQPGQGTTMWITLPCNTTNQQALG